MAARHEGPRPRVASGFRLCPGAPSGADSLSRTASPSRPARPSSLARLFLLPALAVALLPLAGCSLFTPTRAQVIPDQTLTKLSTPSILTKGVLTVGLDASDAPRAMTDDAGEIVGYEPDVARLIAQRLGLSVKFVNASDPAQAGTKFDIYLGASQADATNKVKVTGDILENAPAIYGKATDGSGSGLSTKSTVTTDTLSSATIAVQTGSSSQEALVRAGISGKQKTYANVNECFDALSKGEVAYVACDGTAGAYLARVYADVDFLGSLASPEVAGVAMSASNAQLEQVVGDVLDQISSDGSLDAVHALWFGDMPVSLSDVLVQGVQPGTATSADEATGESDRATAGSATSGDATVSQDASSTGSTASSSVDASSSSGASTSVNADSGQTLGFDPNANAAKTPGTA